MAPNGTGTETVIHDDDVISDGDIVSNADTNILIAKMARHVHHLDRRFDSLEVIIGAQARRFDSVESIQGQHSALLGDIAAAVIRVEKRLGAAEEKAERADVKAERASGTNEIITDFARVKLEEERDEIQGRKARRTAIWSVVGQASAFVFSVAGLSLLASIAFRACNQDPRPTPPTAPAMTSEAQPR